MTALSVGYIQTYRDSVDSLGESVDMSIKVTLCVFEVYLYLCVCVCVCSGVGVCVGGWRTQKFMLVHWGCWLDLWKMKEVTTCREWFSESTTT